MRSPNFPIRLSPERRAVWQEAADLRNCTLTELIKVATDVVAERIIEDNKRNGRLRRLVPPFEDEM